MDNQSSYYIDLISRYFSGDISGDELKLLSDWLSVDAAHQDIFRETQAAWQLLAKSGIDSAVNLDDEWNALHNRIKPKAAETGIKNLQTPGQIQRNMFSRSIGKVAAAIILLVASSLVLYFYVAAPGNIRLTAKTDTMLVRLPDGTAVALNRGSTITYPEKFTGGRRNIEISGEAYLNVSHDKTKPFVISSGNARIEVLGTSFNINTKSAPGKVEVVLTEGKVQVYFKEQKSNSVILAPGEKAEIELARQKIMKTTNSDPNYMAWKTRKLVFDNVTLGEIVQTLNSVYHSNISIPAGDLAGCRLTATFNDQPLKSVLNVLTRTLDLKITQSAKSIEINGNGCH